MVETQTGITPTYPAGLRTIHRDREDPFGSPRWGLDPDTDPERNLPMGTRRKIIG